MAFNTVTSTNEYPLWIVLADGKPVKINVMVVVRDSAIEGMMPLTFKRFSYMCQILAAGIPWEMGATHKVDELPLDEWEDAGEEPAVQIWVKGQGIPVYTADGIAWLAVNVFTERTYAWDLIGMIRMIADELPAMFDIGNEHKPEPKEESELDKAFPKDRAVPQSPAAPASATGTPHFGDFKMKKADKTILAQHWGKSPVSFNIATIVVKPDGIRVYSTFNGQLSQYPMVTLDNRDLERMKDERTKQFLTTLKDSAGSSAKKFLGVFYVNPKPNGTVYLNLNRLEEVQDFPGANTFLPSPDQQPPAAPEREMMREDDPDNIPF